MSSNLVASTIPWSQVCRMFDKVQSVELNKKKENLQMFINQYRKLLIQNKQNNINAVDSFFPVMRLLLPSLDRERGAYGVKEKKLADLYIKIFALHKMGADSQKLLNYKKPSSSRSCVGDFAEVAFQVLKNRCQLSGTLSLHDVDCHLTVIADCYLQKGKSMDLEKELLTMMRNMTAIEQKWLIRVLLKDTHFGIGKNTIFNCWHSDAKNFYDVNNSLLKVCTTLQDPSVHIHEIEIKLFNPIRPMLSARVVLKNIDSQLKGKNYFSETKYDGERSQIHKNGSTYKYFSRNGFDFTGSFGADPKCGSFTPYLHDLFSPEVKNIILDGEMVVWSKKHNAIIPKSANLDVKNVKEDGDWQACFCPFDLLYFNEEVMTNKPLHQRLQKLHEIIKELEGRLILTSRAEVDNSDGVIKALNEAIENKEEGIVLKDPNSIYRPASRKSGWIKVKPDYIDSLVPELDMLIVGGYYGSGKRHGVIAQFLLAVSNQHQEAGSPSEFHTAAKVASGYTDTELQKLLLKLSKYFIKKQPYNVHIGKGKPDVWIEPEKSSVLQVKGAELIRTRQFKTEISLRFPRVETVRTDKSYYDICTSEELNNLYKEGGGKFVGTYDVNLSMEKNNKRSKADVAKSSVVSHFRPADISGIEKKSNIFAGKKLCIMTRNQKHDLEKLVAKNGGSFTQNPDSKTFCVVGDKISIRLQDIISSGKYNVVKKEWFDDCIRTNTLLNWGSIDAWFVTEENSRIMKEKFDEFGDNHIEPLDDKRLKRIINSMGENLTKLSSNEMQEIDELINESTAIFRNVKCLIIQANEMQGEETMVPLKLRLYGGEIVNELDETVTHIFMPLKSSKIQRRIYINKHIINQDWVSKCILENRYLDEGGFYQN